MEELLFQREALTSILKILRGLWRKPVGDQLCCSMCAPGTQGPAAASEKLLSVFSEEWQSVCLALHIMRRISLRISLQMKHNLIIASRRESALV